MKSLVILMVFFMASVAQAKVINFSCELPENSSVGDMDATMKIEGKIKAKGDRLQLQYKGSFGLGCSDDWSNGDSCWADTQLKYGRSTNQVPYNPRRYKNHNKFNVNLDSKNAYGSFELIFPKEELIKDKKTFEAHMIMSYINDHHGGTAHLGCKRTRRFKLPADVADLGLCKKTILKRVAEINECGEDSYFNLYNCRQATAGADVTCGAEIDSPSQSCGMTVTMDAMCKVHKHTEVRYQEKKITLD